MLRWLEFHPRAHRIFTHVEIGLQQLRVRVAGNRVAEPAEERFTSRALDVLKECRKAFIGLSADRQPSAPDEPLTTSLHRELKEAFQKEGFPVDDAVILGELDSFRPLSARNDERLERCFEMPGWELAMRLPTRGTLELQRFSQSTWVGAV